jgi:hypothetical protein
VNLRVAFVVSVVMWTHIGHSLSAVTWQRYPRVCLVTECPVMKEKIGAREVETKKRQRSERVAEFPDRIGLRMKRDGLTGLR